MIAVLAAAAVAAGAAGASDEAGAIARGRALAAAHCARCHAVGASGDSPLTIAPRFRELQADFPVADLVDAIAQGARTGHPVMPEFRFGLGDRRDLIAYVRSIQATPASGGR